MVNLLLILPTSIPPKNAINIEQPKKLTIHGEDGGAAAPLLNDAFHFSWRSPPEWNFWYLHMRVTF
jgi:hypothetical protein